MMRVTFLEAERFKLRMRDEWPPTQGAPMQPHIVDMSEALLQLIARVELLEETAIRRGTKVADGSDLAESDS